MEEILASIKRVIADDSAAALTTPRARGGRPTVVPVEAVPPPAEEAGMDDNEPEVLELTQAMPEPSAPAPEPEEPAVPVSTASPTLKPAASLVSDNTAAASREALSALSRLLVKPEVEADGNTLEGLVREMLRPMLKEWLDAKLPGLVESMVEKEIARITGKVL